MVKGKDLANHELVTIAVYMLGGDKDYIDTEDVAVKADELAPERFRWRKYPEQIDLEKVRKRCHDARRADKGGYLIGSPNKGWMLTEAGVVFARSTSGTIDKEKLRRKPMSEKERRILLKEKRRLMETSAFQKFSEGKSEEISCAEAESVFRLNDYMGAEAREKKITRIANSFLGDEEMQDFVKCAAAIIREVK